MSNSTPIESRIDEAIHDLLNLMKDEQGCTEEYRSMFSHLTKVMELRQKEFDTSEVRNIKLMELQQQKELSETAQDNKISELQQQRLISDAAHELRLRELQQQKSINDDAHSIKVAELEQRNTITKEAWLTVGTHLAGLIVLMNHERAHVIASKAFGFVKKIV